jgi:hypothetical protein
VRGGRRPRRLSLASGGHALQLSTGRCVEPGTNEAPGVVIRPIGRRLDVVEVDLWVTNPEGGARDPRYFGGAEAFRNGLRAGGRALPSAGLVPLTGVDEPERFLPRVASAGGWRDVIAPRWEWREIPLVADLAAGMGARFAVSGDVVRVLLDRGGVVQAFATP